MTDSYPDVWKGAHAYFMRTPAWMFRCPDPCSHCREGDALTDDLYSRSTG